MNVLSVESFTEYIYLGENLIDQEQQVVHHAHFMAAVAQVFLGVKRFYQELKLRDSPELYRLFPSLTYFANMISQRVLTFTSQLEYEGREPGDYRRSLFRAT